MAYGSCIAIELQFEFRILNQDAKPILTNETGIHSKTYLVRCVEYISLNCDCQWKSLLTIVVVVVVWFVCLLVRSTNWRLIRKSRIASLLPVTSLCLSFVSDETRKFSVIFMASKRFCGLRVIQSVSAMAAANNICLYRTMILLYVFVCVCSAIRLFGCLNF